MVVVVVVRKRADRCRVLVVAFSFALHALAAEAYTFVSLSSDFYSFVPNRRIRFYRHMKAFLLTVRTACTGEGQGAVL